LSKAEYELLASFRYALRQFLHFSEEAARAVGLEPQQHQALLAVKGFPGRDWVTVGELAEQLQIRHHSAVGLVNRMETNGWLVRMPASEDRRQVHVALTPQGAALLEQLAAIHKEELRRLGPQLHLLLARLSGESEP
jgi:DNA-binding MarR family transcriptional regulator